MKNKCFIVFYFLLLTRSLYSSIVVTCRLTLMKVKVCYACVHVTRKFRHQNRQKQAVFNKRLKKIFWQRGIAPSPNPILSEEGYTPSPRPTTSAPSATRSSRLRRSTFVPPYEMSGSATTKGQSDDGARVSVLVLVAAESNGKVSFSKK